ncbi:Ca2+/Na+ antiporter [Rahnella inusitata]|nr:Ca2+/Na+ antiporter [Rahnella inusitata]
MIKRKIDLYIVSLGLLFAFFIIITINVPICFSSQCEFIGWLNLLKNNIVPLICFLFLLYGIYAYWSFKYDTKQTTELPFQIKKIEGVNYEHLTFLATYVIPLITFDFEKSRYIIVLSMLLIVMCIIYIKTDLFYANPSLALLGFHIYKVDGEFINAEMREGIIIITRRRLNKNDRVRYIKLDERIYYSDN